MTGALWQRKSLSTATGYDGGNQRFKTMSLQMLKHASKSVGPTVVSVFFAALTLWDNHRWWREIISHAGTSLFIGPSSGRGVGYKSHQEKVLPVELALAEESFKATSGREYVLGDHIWLPNAHAAQAWRYADEAIAMIRDVTLEPTRERYFSVHFYDALSLAISQFTDNTRSKSLLVISEGNDYFPRKTFKETVARAQQLQAACDVAMVADHTLYGTKGIQHMGFICGDWRGKPTASIWRLEQSKESSSFGGETFGRHSESVTP